MKGGVKLTNLFPEKTTLKKPSLVRVKKHIEFNCLLKNNAEECEILIRISIYGRGAFKAQ